MACFKRSFTLSIPRRRGPNGPNFSGGVGSAYLMRTRFGIERPNSPIYGEKRVLGVSHAIAFYTNASRGLSATAKFLVKFGITVDNFIT